MTWEGFGLTAAEEQVLGEEDALMTVIIVAVAHRVGPLEGACLDEALGLPVAAA